MMYRFRVMAAGAWLFALGWTLGVILPRPDGGLPYGTYVVVAVLTVLAVVEKKQWDKRK